MVADSIGKRILALRTQYQRAAKKEHKEYWSRKEFAKRVGIKPGSLWDIEMGRTKRPKDVARFAAELGVTEEYLLHGTNNSGIDQAREAKNFADNYQALTPANKALVTVMMEKLLQQQEEAEMQ